MATALASRATPVSLVEVAEDRQLCGLTLSDGQRELAELIERSGTCVIAAGRQSGKSTLAAVTAIHNLLCSPELDRMAGRSARAAICVANSKEQSAILLSFVREFTERSPLLRRRIEQLRDDRITFSGGRTLIAAPCSAPLVRGLRASLLVLDEAAHMLSESWGPRTAARILVALRPATITFGEHSKTIVASTPGSDWFADLYAKAEAGELPRAAVFTAPTATMNPAVSEAYLASEEALLGPADFAREYLGQFTPGGSSAMFDADELRACVGRYVELPPDEITGAVLGIDPAFAGDATGIAIVGRSVHDSKRLVVAKVARWAPQRTRAQRRAAKSEQEVSEVRDAVLDATAELARRYGATVVSDQHLARVILDGLRERGIDRVRIEPWTGKVLARAFSALRARVVAGTIELPRDEQLVAELLRIRSRTRGGTLGVEVPRSVGSHMDSALALVAAVHRLESRAPGRARVFSALSPFQRWGEPVKQDPRGKARVYSSFGGELSDAALERIEAELAAR